MKLHVYCAAVLFFNGVLASNDSSCTEKSLFEEQTQFDIAQNPDSEDEITPTPPPSPTPPREELGDVLFFTNDFNEYWKHLDCGLTRIESGQHVSVELRYASKKNVTGQRIYPKNAHCYLRTNAAEALKQVTADLAAQGYGLVIWDAYQPQKAQQEIWNLIQNKDLVIDPAETLDAHARGMAVDVTMFSLESERVVAMPCDFDCISKKACRGCKKVSYKARRNLKILTEAMVQHGFEPCQEAWWHFEYRGWQETAPVGLEFAEIE